MFRKIKDFFKNGFKKRKDERSVSAIDADKESLSGAQAETQAKTCGESCSEPNFIMIGTGAAENNAQHDAQAETQPENNAQQKEQTEKQAVTQADGGYSYALEQSAQTVDKDIKKGKKGQDIKETAEFSALYELAKLLNVSAETVKDECCLYQIKNITAKLGKVAVRYNVPDAELSATMFNCRELGIKEALVSPAHLPACAKGSAKLGLGDFFVGAAIDFPFGESSYKAKLTEIKNCFNGGADGVTVIFSSMDINHDKRKQFRKRVKSLGRQYKGRLGAAFDANDLTSEELKFVLSTVEKTKIGFITLMFGETTESAVELKMRDVKKLRGKKTVKILCNVSTPEYAMELIKLGADEVLTPFADDMAKSLIKRFGIKSLKLR